MAFATAKAAFCAAFLSFLEVAYTVNKRMTKTDKPKPKKNMGMTKKWQNNKNQGHQCMANWFF